MTKYIQSDRELIKGLVVAMCDTPLMPIAILLGVGVVITYVAKFEFWFFIVTYALVGLFGLLFLAIVMSYGFQKRLSAKGHVEVKVGTHGLSFYMGDIRNEIPYSVIKSTRIRSGFFILHILGGNVVAVPIDKLSGNEKKKIIERLKITI